MAGKITLHNSGESTTLTGMPSARASCETRALIGWSSVAAIASTLASQVAIGIAARRDRAALLLHQRDQLRIELWRNHP